MTILINNAGILIARTFLKCSDEELKKQVDVNTISHFWVSSCLCYVHNFLIQIPLKFHLANLFARHEARTRIQLRDWLAKKFVAL